MELNVKIISAAGERSGNRKSDGTPWRVVSFLFEEAEAKYPDTFCGDVWDTTVADWMTANIGETCKVLAAFSVDQWNERWYNRVKILRADIPAVETPQTAPQTAPQGAPQDTKEDAAGASFFGRSAQAGMQTALDLKRAPKSARAADEDDDLPF